VRLKSHSPALRVEWIILRGKASREDGMPLPTDVDAEVFNLSTVADGTFVILTQPRRS
jgi:hypothetical protein